ncbi:hypothetical protein B0H10DRAFT_748830 [Mycena sp. CBHHK59/15]|nr:hypothetical protein B0H10DRAFT_748830 [Mycena sp. CBHHK59/15]
MHHEMVSTPPLPPAIETADIIPEFILSSTNPGTSSTRVQHSGDNDPEVLPLIESETTVGDVVDTGSVNFIPIANEPSISSPELGHSTATGEFPCNSETSKPMCRSRTTLTLSGKPRKPPKMHECNICQKHFLRPSALKIHMNVHDHTKLFACEAPECPKTFGVRSNALRHFLTHGIPGSRRVGRPPFPMLLLSRSLSPSSLHLRPKSKTRMQR